MTINNQRPKYITISSTTVSSSSSTPPSRPHRALYRGMQVLVRVTSTMMVGDNNLQSVAIAKATVLTTDGPQVLLMYSPSNMVGWRLIDEVLPNDYEERLPKT